MQPDPTETGGPQPHTTHAETLLGKKLVVHTTKINFPCIYWKAEEKKKKLSISSTADTDKQISFIN